MSNRHLIIALIIGVAVLLTLLGIGMMAICYLTQPLPINGGERLIAVWDVVSYGVDGNPPCLSYGVDGACLIGYEYAITAQDGDIYRLSPVFNRTYENNTDLELKDSWQYVNCSYMSPSSRDAPHDSGSWNVTVSNKNYFFGCGFL